MTRSKNRPQYKTDEQRLNYPIVRCNRPERFKVAFYSLSTDVWGEEVHWGGKSHICTMPDKPCSRCDGGHKTRWYGYLAATNYDRTKLFIVELTPGIMPTVEAYFDRWGSLRGAYLTLTRPSHKDQGRLEIDILRNDVAVSPNDLPPAFDLQKVLHKIYGLADDLVSQELIPSSVSSLEGPPAEVPTMPSACERRSTPQGADDQGLRLSEVLNGFDVP